MEDVITWVVEGGEEQGGRHGLVGRRVHALDLAVVFGVRQVRNRVHSFIICRLSLL